MVNHFWVSPRNPSLQIRRMGALTQISPVISAMIQVTIWEIASICKKWKAFLAPHQQQQVGGGVKLKASLSEGHGGS